MAVEWVCKWTFRGECMTFIATNKPFEFQGSWFLTMSEGKIAVKKSYWDTISLFAQLMTF